MLHFFYFIYLVNFGYFFYSMFLCPDFLSTPGSTPPLNCCAHSNSVSPIPCREIRRSDHCHCYRNEQHGAYRGLDFRNTSPSCPLRAAFGAGRAMTVPEFNSKDIWPSMKKKLLNIMALY